MVWIGGNRNGGGFIRDFRGLYLGSTADNAYLALQDSLNRGWFLLNLHRQQMDVVALHYTEHYARGTKERRAIACFSFAGRKRRDKVKAGLIGIAESVSKR